MTTMLHLIDGPSTRLGGCGVSVLDRMDGPSLRSSLGHRHRVESDWARFDPDRGRMSLVTFVGARR